MAKRNLHIDANTIRKILREYYGIIGTGDDMFTKDEEAVICMKHIMRRLPAYERNIIILYAETGSLRETARMLGCSHQTIAKEIRRIREKIKGMR